MRLVIALGGNALLRSDEAPQLEVLRSNVDRAAAGLVDLLAANEVVVTHGNGPQVGLLAEQMEADHDVRPYPLDVLDAETEGLIGYLVEAALAEVSGRRVATLLSRVRVADDDPAFAAPSKPIGPVYEAAEGAALARERGWKMAADHRGVRRVVASPEPLDLTGSEAVALLLEHGYVVVCAGGGGIPFARRPDGTTRGVEAVVDKDLTAALLAVELDADRLVLLTDVDAVYEGWATPNPTPIRSACVSELRAREFHAGTMGPKVEAACRFAAATGRPAFIGALGEAAAVAAGRNGTAVEP